MADLSGKVVVVTGAGRGLGFGIAEGLAEAGATVCLSGRTVSDVEPPAEGSVQAGAGRVDVLGGRGVAYGADHTRARDVRRLFERLQAEQGRIDVLVNHLQPGRATALACAAAQMAEQGRGLVVEVSWPGDPEPRAGAASNLPAGVTLLRLVVRPDKPRFSGRCVAALAMDPDIAEKAGGTFRVDDLVSEYRFSDPDDPIPGT